MNTRKKVRKAAEATSWNPMSMLSDWGIRSSHLYCAGAIAAGFSALRWLISRRGDNPSRLHVGTFAPTLIALGVGLKLEEES